MELIIWPCLVRCQNQKAKGSAVSEQGKITGVKKVVGDPVEDNQKGREFALTDLLYSGNEVN